MEFDYFIERRVNASLDVDDIGNVCIEGMNDKGETYILVIDTSLGLSRIMEYGPATPDMDLLPKTVNCSFKRINFTQAKLIKTINEFLNDPYAHITSARVVEKDIALADCKNIVEYMGQSDLY